MSNLTFKLTALPQLDYSQWPTYCIEIGENHQGEITRQTWHWNPSSRTLGRKKSHTWIYEIPKNLYEFYNSLRSDSPILPTLSHSATDGLSVTIPGHGKEALLALHNTGHFNNAPLWKSHASLVRHLAGMPGNSGLAVNGQWHLNALRNDCIHSIIQSIYDGLSGQEVFHAIVNEAGIGIGELAHDAAECYFPMAADGTVSRHSDHASNEAAETHYRALCARVRADKDATAPKLRHNMTVAQFKAAFPPPPPPAAPMPEPSVSLRAYSTNYRTNTVVTAVVTRVRDALGGTIYWQLQQPGRLGWADLQTDANPPVAVTGETFTPTAEGRYRAEIRGALDVRGMPVASAISDEFVITTA